MKITWRHQTSLIGFLIFPLTIYGFITTNILDPVTQATTESIEAITQTVQDITAFPRPQFDSEFDPQTNSSPFRRLLQQQIITEAAE